MTSSTVQNGRFLRKSAFLLSIFFVFVSAVRAQNSPTTKQSTLVCRDLTATTYYDGKRIVSSSFILEGEIVVGNQACHLQAVDPAPVAQPASVVTDPMPAKPPADPPAVPLPAPVTAVMPANPMATPVVAPAVPAVANPLPTPKNEARADGRKRIFLTDEPLDERFFIGHAGNGGQGNSGGGTGYSQRGANPRTVEIYALIFHNCTNVVATDDPAKANYVLLFRRDDTKRTSLYALAGLYGLALSANSKINGAALFSADSGDLLYATEARTVKKAIEAACGNIR